MSRASEPIHYILLKVISCNFQDVRKLQFWSTTLRETQNSQSCWSTEMTECSSRSPRTSILLVWETRDSKHPNPLPIQFSLSQHLQVTSIHLSQHPFRIRCPTCQMMKAPKGRVITLKTSSDRAISDCTHRCQHIIGEGLSLRE